MKRVAHEWKNRIEAEYASAALAAECLHWLIVTGQSPELIDTAHRIVRDELDHAELSRQVYLNAGGSIEQVEIDVRRLFIPYRDEADLLARLFMVCADFFCCGETVARPLFRAMLDNAKEPLVETALQQIIKDEARHSAFGWALLDALLEHISDEERALRKTKITQFVDRICQTYSRAQGQDGDPIYTYTGDELAWGLLQPGDYAAISQKCVEETIRPRFTKRGLL